ncbi:hypothetical protein EDF84_103110 [Erwinia rhapontici]|nr:hypothetical protein EDF84_103110 [Erwinia rhapontici]
MSYFGRIRDLVFSQCIGFYLKKELFFMSPWVHLPHSTEDLKQTKIPLDSLPLEPQIIVLGSRGILLHSS